MIRLEMVTSKVFVCLVYLCSLFIKQSEQCIVREIGYRDLPSFQNYGYNGVERITLHRQAIIPSYEFTCCGNITEWGVDVQPGGGGDDGDYALDLQVWRPSPTVDDSTGAGQYSLVGNNRFTSISLDNDVAQVAPLAQNQVQFRPGDVLGFYVEEARNNDNDRGVNVLTTATFTSETVWYASVTTLNTMCSPVSVGSSGVLNTQLRGAPVISIASETYNCPQITSTPPPCPTATTTTPQPTMPPTVPTDPGSPTDPVTEDSTTSDMVTHNPTLSPTPTEASTDMDLTTDPASSTTSDDNRMPSTGSSGQGTVIAIVVVVVIITIILAILVALLIAFTVLKKRGKEFTVTHTDFNAGISVSTATNPDYEVIDLKSTTATNPRIANLQDVDASLEYDIVTKQNDAYISVVERRDGPGARDAIITETNEAYISISATGSTGGARDAIVTERNEAYSVTSRSANTETETVDEYDYI